MGEPVKVPYDALSVNGRAMEWMSPLWDAINARNWKDDGSHAAGRVQDVGRVNSAVERAMRLAVECDRRAHPAPPREREEDERVAFFNWLNENPQAAAFIAVLVAQNKPYGPTLWATMASGEVVGVAEDARNPEYRFTHAPPAAPEVTEAGLSEFTAWLLREMPEQTIIADPTWWAPRLYRAALRAARPEAGNNG